MSSIAEIKHHIKAIGETAKITRAMHLISSAKMKKALQAHDQTIQYFNQVRSNMRFILENSPDDFQSDFYRANGRRACYLVIAGDKGLCGGYNHDVLKFAYGVVTDTSRHQNTKLITFGHMATDFFRRKRMPIAESYLTAVQNPTLNQARELAASLCNSYKRDEFDEVFIIYTQMMKGGVMVPTRLSLLPITKHTVKNAAMHTPTAGLNYWPDARSVLDSMAQHYVVGVLYSCLVQSFASENRARMTAMESATRNADEMLKKLRLQLNHARQAAITQEINEIIGGNPDSFTL
jgi:F-type H+-transporting ATPase subunit gamma